MIKKLDGLFSTFIRLRDSDGSGTFRCFTCGIKIFYGDADCGHGVDRKHMATRFDERNCQGQCRTCNRYRGGEQKVFAQAVDKKYGHGTWVELQRLSRTTVKRTKADLLEMVQYYREKVRELKEERGLI